MTDDTIVERSRLDTIEQAIEDLGTGRAVVVVDDEDRENEGDLVFAAARATPPLLAFMIKHTSGVVCVPMLGEHLDRLRIPPMTYVNEDRKKTAYTVSVDARDGVSTGISASDRSHTIRVLVDSATEPFELTRPGHVFPLRAVEEGVLRRPGHTEAAVDLARLAGLTPAGVIAEIVNDDGSMARLPDLLTFAHTHGLTIVSIADLIRYRRRTERTVTRDAETRIPTRHGEFRAVGYRDTVTGTEHVALVRGDLGDGQDVLVRVHSECLTGDVLGSTRCDCGPQLPLRLSASLPKNAGSSCTCAGTRGAGSGCSTSCRRTNCRTVGLTPWTPTSSWGSRQMPGTTAPAPRFCPTSACTACACCPTTRRSGRGWRATDSASSGGSRCRRT